LQGREKKKGGKKGRKKKTKTQEANFADGGTVKKKTSKNKNTRQTPIRKGCLQEKGKRIWFKKNEKPRTLQRSKKSRIEGGNLEKLRKRKKKEDANEKVNRIRSRGEKKSPGGGGNAIPKNTSSRRERLKSSKTAEEKKTGGGGRQKAFGGGGVKGGTKGSAPPNALSLLERFRPEGDQRRRKAEESKKDLTGMALENQVLGGMGERSGKMLMTLLAIWG